MTNPQNSTAGETRVEIRDLTTVGELREALRGWRDDTPVRYGYDRLRRQRLRLDQIGVVLEGAGQIPVSVMDELAAKPCDMPSDKETLWFAFSHNPVGAVPFEAWHAECCAYGELPE